MMDLAGDRGIAVVCDEEGLVRAVLRDELGLATRIPVGTSVLALVNPEDEAKGRGFLAALRNIAATFDWEITVRLVDGELTVLHFTGGRVSDGLLIVAAASRDGVDRVNTELMRINNESVNALRVASQQIAAQSLGRDAGDEARYSELSAVNNELANLQRELARNNAQLEQIIRERDQLLGMAAHDLRTPLGIILSYSDFLATEALLTEEQQSFITTIKDTSRFMLDLVDDLLTVAAIESGQLRLDLELADVGALVRDNVALNRVLAGKKEIDIALTAPAVGPLAEVDAGKLQQVLNNLIGNAIKFSRRGQRVEVEVRHDDGWAQIVVRDHGKGIPERDLDKLFKPFGQASARGTEGEEGTGLGLTIARRIVEGHRGRIGVTSVVGQGSAFTFRLPAHLSRTDDDG